jgi:hypothetical protein
MAVEREKIYECEVKRRRVKAGGGYEPFWKVKNVAMALVDNDTEFRCKDCFGEVKLLGRNSKVGAPAYVEHKHAVDSEYCAGGMLFRKATDGREAKTSAHPIE